MRRITRGVALAVVGAAAVGGVAEAPPAHAAVATTVTVPGSAPVGGAVAVGPVAGTKQLSVQVWLSPDEAGAAQFDAGVSTPGSVGYRQYLSPDEYSARFGPSVGEASAVSGWLSAAGLSDVQVSSQRDYVSATAPVSVIDAAFGVTMTRYRESAAGSGSATFVSNDQALSVPAALAPDVMSVTGLSGSPAPPSPASSTPVPANAGSSSASTHTPCSAYYGQHVEQLPRPFEGITQAARQVCGYSATQIRAAYGLTPADDGSGVTVAIVGVGSPGAVFATLSGYAAANGLPAPQSTQVRQEVIGSDRCESQTEPQAFAAEAQEVYAMAPAATELLVEGDDCALGGPAGLEDIQPTFAAESAVLAGDGSSPQATIIDAPSLTPDETSLSLSIEETAHAIALRAVAEGVGMYVPANYTPAREPTKNLAVSIPGSDPDVTSVGETTLGIGEENQVLFQTGFSSAIPTYVKGVGWVGPNRYFGGGGGRSLLWAQPSYQAGVVPPSMSTQFGRTDRTVPDLAADGDLMTPMQVGYAAELPNGQAGPYQVQPINLYNGSSGGTATSLIAGMIADAQQGQSSSIGFANPLLYSLAGTPAFDDILPLPASLPGYDRMSVHPAQAVGRSWEVFGFQRRPFTQQLTAPGYDTTTGLGTPNGQAFIAALGGGS